MARPPVTEVELVARYGPHLNEAPPGGWEPASNSTAW
jgi:hypothetical protein